MNETNLTELNDEQFTDYLDESNEDEEKLQYFISDNEELTHTFFIAGVKFHELHTVIGELSVGTELSLVPEPTNPYDSNAVRIFYDQEAEGGINLIMLGYIPAKFSSEITAKLEAERKLRCIITTLNPDEKPWNKCEVSIFQTKD